MDHTYTMCLKKSKFKELLDDNPDAKKFYMKRAWERRIEFRRKLKSKEMSLNLNKGRDNP